MRCLQLPFRFDAAKLHADLARVAPRDWIPHINRQHHDRQWSSAALCSLDVLVVRFRAVFSAAKIVGEGLS